MWEFKELQLPVDYGLVAPREVNISTCLVSGWESGDLAALGAVCRSGRFLFVLRTIQAMSLRFIYINQWGLGIKFYTPTGIAIYDLCFLYCSPIFIRRLASLKRKAGTKRPRLTWRHIYLPETRRLHACGWWYDTFQRYFYHPVLAERMGAGYLHLFTNRAGNKFLDQRQRIGELVLGTSQRWGKARTVVYPKVATVDWYIAIYLKLRSLGK